MRKFQAGQRVVVVNYQPLHLWAGTVRRCRIQDDSAWVRMDAAPPSELRHFADGAPRQWDVLLAPGWCEPEAK